MKETQVPDQLLKAAGDLVFSHQEGKEYRFGCPICGSSDNLSISWDSRRSREVVKCWSECHRDWREFLKALHAHGCVLSGDSGEYVYTDESGQPLYRIKRWLRKGEKKKRSKMERYKVSSAGVPAWFGGKGAISDVRKVLYQLPDVLAAVQQNREIWLCEGEKDADALREHGVCATTASNGQQWLQSYTDALNGARLVIVPDKDDTGVGYRRALRIYGDVRESCTVRFALAAIGKDPYDHFTSGKGVDEFTLTSLEELQGLVALTGAQFDESGVPIADPVPDEEWTELGYANRFVKLYGEKIRFVPLWNEWLYWDGMRFRHDDLLVTQEYAKAFVRQMTRIARDEPTEDGKAPPHLRFALGHETTAAVSSILRFAGSHPDIACTPQSFDANPYLLNTPGGVYVLDSGPLNTPNGIIVAEVGEILPHDPCYMLTRITKGSYNPQANGDRFKAFMERVQPNVGMRKYLARLFGCMLEGRISEQVLAVFYGVGANGKSTLTDAVSAVLGNYATDVDWTVLSDPDKHPTGIASLSGKRIAFANELGALHEGRVKLLVSSGRLQARRMREDFWTFTPSHNIIASSNEKPKVRGGDEGIWRRVLTVPWDVQIPEKEWDKQLTQKIVNECADFIMTWLIRGHRQWRNVGLQPTQHVVETNTELRAANDPIHAWLQECVILDPLAEELAASLYESFAAWHKKFGDGRPMSIQMFGRRLTDKNYHKRRSDSGNLWRGMRLR